MKIPTATVAVCEANETRAELYSLWLDECEVRIALTAQQAKDKLDDEVAVVVLNQGFADGKASQVLSSIREQTSVCRVIETRDRSEAFPSLGVDHNLVKPIFEDVLVEKVRTLLRRVNYQVALDRYYKVTISITTLELKSELSDEGRERHEQLSELATDLQRFLSELRAEMSEDDLRAVMQSINIETGGETADVPQKIESKYRPEKCGNCGQAWDPKDSDEPGMVRLGAYVWRCKRCGDVQMYADPSHQQLSSYRK